MPLFAKYPEGVRQVVFPLCVVVVHFFQGVEQLAVVKTKRAGIDFAHLSLFLAGIFLLYDTFHIASVRTKHPAVTRRVVDNGCQHGGRNAFIGKITHKIAVSLDGDERIVSVDDES